MKTEQITVWRKPDTKMDTEYGRVAYEKWCDLEIKRLSKGEKYYKYYLRSLTQSAGDCIAIFKRKKGADE